MTMSAKASQKSFKDSYPQNDDLFKNYHSVLKD